ncbi:DUF4145 domain-containing protein [Candidatus Palauibacter sp.]|uniref:DUF4145 domain-containing protein n=1 Tax=Candidatus Palauibacter sp. TaxID=3101350 RepID=UPI003B5A5941
MPQLHKTIFRCPTCSIMAQMQWVGLSLATVSAGRKSEYLNNIAIGIDRSFFAAFCQAKGCVSIWMTQKDTKRVERETDVTPITNRMIYPRTNAAPPPPNDLPESAKLLYVEAGNVMADSPRAAAALLRMCTEDIIKGLSKNQDVDKLLPTKATLYQHIEFLRKNDELWPGGVIDTGLDALRFIGNDAVHSTEIRGDDDRGTVEGLFRVILMITDALITRRREVHEFEQLIAKPTHGKET